MPSGGVSTTVRPGWQPAVLPGRGLCRPAGAAGVGAPLPDRPGQGHRMPGCGGGAVEFVVRPRRAQAFGEPVVGGIPHDPQPLQPLQPGRPFAVHRPGAEGPPLVRQPPAERVRALDVVLREDLQVLLAPPVPDGDSRGPHRPGATARRLASESRGTLLEQHGGAVGALPCFDGDGLAGPQGEGGEGVRVTGGVVRAPLVWRAVPGRRPGTAAGAGCPPPRVGMSYPPERVNWPWNRARAAAAHRTVQRGGYRTGVCVRAGSGVGSDGCGTTCGTTARFVAGTGRVPVRPNAGP